MDTIKFFTSLLFAIVVFHSSQLTAQETERSVLIFDDGEKVFGVLQESTSPTIVIIELDDGTVMSYYRPSIRAIVEESRLEDYLFRSMDSEISLSLSAGISTQNEIGSNFGFKAGYTHTRGYSFNFQVLFHGGGVRERVVDLFMQDDETVDLYENLPVIEKTSVSTYTINFEYSLSETGIRFRPFIAVGLAMLSNEIDLPEFPDDNVRLLDEISSGNTIAFVLPIGLVIEYPVVTNFLIGIDVRYQHMANPKERELPRGWYQSFLESTVNTLSASMSVGVRL